MNITITDEAKDKLKDVLNQSEFKSPAIRIVMSGIG